MFKKCWRTYRGVSIIGLNDYNSCRREARKINEYSCRVTARQFVRVRKLVDDTLRSRPNRRQIQCSAVEPSSKVLLHIYTRNETFDSFDNFLEEICPGITSVLLRSGTHLRYGVGNPFKTTSLSSDPGKLVLLLSGILETQIMLERNPPALKNDEFDRPLSRSFNGHAYAFLTEPY